MRQAIGFVNTSQGRVAYATVGSGPPLLCDTGWVSHLEFSWREAAYRDFFEALAAGHTVIRYDKPGTGLSDRARSRYDIEPEVEAVTAVVDHLDLARLSLFGASQGGPVVAAYASRNPGRVKRVVLYGTFACGAELAADALKSSLVALVKSNWGLGSELLADLFLPGCDSAAKEWFSEAQQASATAQMAADLLAANYLIDVRAELSAITAPTMVIHREKDRVIPFGAGRELAAMIPDATFVPLGGRAHLPYYGDANAVLQAIAHFLPAAAASTPPPLSPREMEVATLVAEGLTNGEIASRLTISPRTADSHVENIRARLGFRSRAQIGAWLEQRKRPTGG